MKKVSTLIICMVMIAAMLVPCAVTAAPEIITDFQSEEIGAYTGDLIYNPEGDTFVKYEIKEENGTKFLRADFSGLNDENKPSTKTRTGINLLTGNETIGAVRVEARVRIPQVIGESGNYLCVYTGMAGGQLGQLGWISDKSFAVGAAPNGAVINDTTYDTGKSGSVIRTYSSIVGQWYNLTFFANPDGGKVSITVRDDDGELLGSASWANSGPFTEWSNCFKELRLSNEYLLDTRAASIDVSKIKVTLNAKEDDDKVNNITVSIAGNGSVSVDGKTIENGKKFTVNKGEETTVTLVPASGAKATEAKIGDTELTITDNKIVIPALTEDKTLSVKFTGGTPAVVDEDIVVVNNFEGETVGAYNGDYIYNPEGDKFVKYEIKEEDGTKYLHADFSELSDENKPSGRTRTGVYLIRDNDIKGLVKVEARVRFPQVKGRSGNALCVYTEMGGGQRGQLGWISEKAFAVGTAPNGAVINDTTYDTGKSGSVIRTYSSIVGQWYNLIFTANPESGEVSFTINDDKGNTLGSANWTNSDAFTEWSKRFKEFRLSNEYLNEVCAADIDVSEVRFTYKSSEVRPLATNVRIEKSGSVLTGKYTYSHNSNAAEAESEYRWLRGTDLDDVSSWTVVKTGTCTAAAAPTYELTDADDNQYLVFEVTPKTTVEPTTGVAAQSAPFAAPSAPVANNVTITGSAVVGRELTGSYTYFDANGDEEEGSVFAWLYSDTADGAYNAAPVDAAKTITVPESLSGKYVKFSVTPKNTADKGNDAKSYESAPLLISSANIAPTASNVKISGKAAVGSTITGEYTFADENNDTEGTSRYQWYMLESPDGTPSAIKGATEKTFEITENYSGRYLMFEVVPVDTFDLAGSAVKSDPVQVVVVKDNQIFVATDGDDSGDGTISAPFATLEKARDTVRKMIADNKLPEGGVTVYLREGTYHLSKTFSLDQSDSGTEDSPIVYRPYGNEKVSISGGKDVDLSKFKPVDGEMKSKLRSADAQGKVLEGDLSELGLTDLQQLSADRYILYGPLFEVDKKDLTLSHWPNSNFRSEWEPAVVTESTPSDPTKPIKLQYTSDVISNWTHNTSDIWFIGFWRFDWAAEWTPVDIDKDNKIISIKKTLHYGAREAGITRNLKVYNVYEEIDEPGEFYVDYTNNKMYFYPVDGMNADSKMTVTNVNFDLVRMNNVSNVSLVGLEITGSRQRALSLSNCVNVAVDGCDIHMFGTDAITISGDNSRNTGIKNSELYHFGTSGVTLGGGVESSITPAGNYVTNCGIHDFSTRKEVYGAAVYLDGVGNIVNHNDFYNSQHHVISFHGIDNVIEYNDFHEVCRNAADMGAIYTGRDITDQEMTIRYNHFYNVGSSIASQFYPCCIFTDDGSSNMDVYNNVLGPGVENVEVFKVHGGIDNNFYNNLLIDAPQVIYQASWSKTAWYGYLSGDTEPSFKAGYDRIKDNQLYLDRWPYLADIKKATSADDIVYLDEYPNTITGNVYMYIDAAPGNTYKYSGSYGYIPHENNLTLKNEPELYKTYFEDWDGGNYALTDEGYQRIRKAIPGFSNIPYESIGRLTDENNPPVAANVKIVRGGADTLIGSYTYTDSERDPEGASIIRWLAADNDQYSEYTEISGAVTTAFKYGAEYARKYIRMEVTPVDTLGRKGTPVRSQAIYIVTGQQDFLAQIDEAQKKLDAAESGSALGQYPADAITALRDAIDEAKEANESGAAATPDGLAEASEKLDSAIADFANARVTSITDSRGSGNINIPSDLEKIDLTLSDVTGTITLSGSVLPQGKITAKINGKTVTVEISAPVSLASGKFTISAVDNLDMDELQKVGLACQIGEIGETYSPALNVTVDGVTESRVSYVKNSFATEIPGLTISEQQAKFALTEGSTIVAYEGTVKSSDSTLKKLAVNGTEISLSKDKFTYAIVLPEGTTSATITAEANHKAATVDIPTVSALPARSNEIVVTAENGSKSVYRLSITVKASAAPDDDNNNGDGNGGGGTVSNPYGGNKGNGGFYSSDTTNPNLDTVFCFNDIQNHWAKADIMAMYRLGVVSGVTETTFDPDRNITRAEFAALIARALKLEEKTGSKFGDVEDGSWYAGYVNACAEAEIITGFDGKFRPGDTITRSEMAVIISNAYSYLGKKGENGGIDKFEDKGAIADWAKPAVDVCTTAGLISGMTDTTFEGDKTATRAQAASILKRLLDK